MINKIMFTNYRFLTNVDIPSGLVCKLCHSEYITKQIPFSTSSSSSWYFFPWSSPLFLSSPSYLSNLTLSLLVSWCLIHFEFFGWGSLSKEEVGGGVLKVGDLVGRLSRGGRGVDSWGWTSESVRSSSVTTWSWSLKRIEQNTKNPRTLHFPTQHSYTFEQEFLFHPDTDRFESQTQYRTCLFLRTRYVVSRWSSQK
jgi:hypothetical protein